MKIIIPLKNFTVLFCFFLFFSMLFSSETVLIKDPKPTHFEKEHEYIELDMVHKIPAEIDEEHFFARPSDLKVDKEGNIFVFDDLLDKIFIFDRNFKLQRVFGYVGQGPGDWGKSGYGSKHLYIGSDGNLYVSDCQNKKILVFDKKGNHLKDINFPFKEMISFYPVVDQQNNFYIISESSGAVDIFDNTLKRTHTFLTLEAYKRFILRIPVYKTRSGKTMYSQLNPGILNTNYEVFSDNGLIIYLANSSTAFVFRDKKLVHQFDIHPEKAVEIFSLRIQKKLKKLKNENSGFYMPMFYDLIIDKDDERFFYISCNDIEKKRNVLYKFDLKGRLIGLYYTKISIKCRTKINHFYYCLDSLEGGIYIFKENKRGEK